MTEEQKDCKKCECCKLVCKFFFLSGAVFLGTLMALLFAHALLKPQCPPCMGKMMRPYLGIERQMPPRMFKNLPPRADFGRRGPEHFRMHQRKNFQKPIQQPENGPFKLEATKNR